MWIWYWHEVSICAVLISAGVGILRARASRLGLIKNMILGPLRSTWWASMGLGGMCSGGDLWEQLLGSNIVR